MSEVAEAVFKTVGLADDLEIEYLSAIEGRAGSIKKCIGLLSEIRALQDRIPFALDDLPDMMIGFFKAHDADGQALNGNDLAGFRPIAEGFVNLCRNGYLDYFNDLSDGGLSEVMIQDRADRDRDRHALLIYLVSPFMDNISIKGHTNAADAISIAEVLDGIGYSVDVINPWYKGDIDYDRYDLVIGFRKAFEDMLPHLRNDCIKICYLTTMNSYVANMAELKRVNDFYDRNGIRPAFRRLEYSCMDLERMAMCDAAICLGNGHTLSTYGGMFKKIYPQNVSGFPISISRDKETGRDFMWYGGAGSLHKGVDLCIEAFRELPDCNLHIVGAMDDDIYEYYREELEKSPNVFYHGFMYHDDGAFEEVCRKCAFSVGLSCSESQSTAMITSIFAGMIPVCVDETGIDTEEYGGIRIGSTDIPDLIKQLSSIAKMSEEEIERRRQTGLKKVNMLHTPESYREQLKDNIEKVERDTKW